MNKAILIVDPQIDFIAGTLPVPGAADALDRLAEHLQTQDDEYVVKLVTMDWHPYFHCSFQQQGGLWPRHCVQNTFGASIYQPLIAPLFETEGKPYFFKKGNVHNREEYSILQNQLEGHLVLQTFNLAAADEIEVCGLAGDVCVMNTVNDLIKAGWKEKLVIRPDFCASINPQTFDDFINEQGIKVR